MVQSRGVKSLREILFLEINSYEILVWQNSSLCTNSSVNGYVLRRITRRINIVTLYYVLIKRGQLRVFVGSLCQNEVNLQRSF